MTLVLLGKYDDEWAELARFKNNKSNALATLWRLRRVGVTDQYMLVRSEHWATYKTLREAVESL